MLSLTPLHSRLGAEVTGVDLTQPLCEDTFARLHEAFELYSVLVLRDQRLSDEQQVAFARRFGPLEVTKPGTLGHGSHLVILTNVDAQGELVPETHRQWLDTRANQQWHSDSSFKRVPALASLLSGREVPPQGGETEFASMRAAWEELPTDLRAQVGGRTAVHDYAHSRARIDPDMMTAEERVSLPPVRQVMVREFPGGDRALYVGSHVSEVDGLTRDASQALVDRLLAFATEPQKIYAHHWRRHDLLLWDNRCVIHRGRPFPPGLRRHLVRVTVAGDGPTLRQ